MLGEMRTGVTRMAAALSFSALAFGWGHTAEATIFTLIDDNSTAVVDVDSQAGMSSWIVDGVEHLNKQWFWFRVGDTGPEASIDSLTRGPTGTFDTDLDGDIDSLTTNYLGSGFRIEIKYSLQGGAVGTGWADIAEQIKVTNTSSTQILDMHFFQYSDFNLGGDSGDDTVSMRNTNAVAQFDDRFSASETVVTPQPNRFQLATVPGALNTLNDGVATDLANGISAAPLSLGPSDVSWTLQWDFVVAPGLSMQISKDKQITRIPEPMAAVLLGLGLMGLGVVRRRA